MIEAALKDTVGAYRDPRGPRSSWGYRGGLRWNRIFGR